MCATAQNAARQKGMI